MGLFNWNSPTMTVIAKQINDTLTSVTSNNTSNATQNCTSSQLLNFNESPCQTCPPGYPQVEAGSNVTIGNINKQVCQLNSSFSAQNIQDLVSSLNTAISSQVSNNQTFQQTLGSGIANVQNSKYTTDQEFYNDLSTLITVDNVNSCFQALSQTQTSNICFCGVINDSTVSFLNNNIQFGIANCLFQAVNNAFSSTTDIGKVMLSVDNILVSQESGIAGIFKAIGSAIAKIFSSVWGTIIAISVIAIIILIVIFALIFRRKKSNNQNYTYLPYQPTPATGYGMPVVYQPQLTYPTTQIPQYSRVA